MGFIENPKEYPTHFFDAGNGMDPFGIISELAVSIDPLIDVELLRKIHYDIVDMYRGKHPLFKRNTMIYHSLRHTMMVALAAMRFLHGIHLQKKKRIDQKTLLQGMLCAYFHDVGMLLKSDDSAENASIYIPVHEKRSAEFLKEYITANRLDPELAEDVEIIIAYTWLSKDPRTFPPHSKRVQMIGQLVGASDLLAQMGDRYYLESLPDLFTELQWAKLNIHSSVMELMEHTVSFYQDVAKVRFFTAYFEVFDSVRLHFLDYYGINKNLYVEAIDTNMRYLQKILRLCSDMDCIFKYLHRKAPVVE